MYNVAMLQISDFSSYATENWLLWLSVPLLVRALLSPEFIGSFISGLTQKFKDKST